MVQAGKCYALRWLLFPLVVYLAAVNLRHLFVRDYSKISVGDFLLPTCYSSG